MLNFRTRSLEPELLDANDIPFEDIRQNMNELAFINRWLGGHAITLRGIRSLLHGDTLSIAEIGCGGGDNLSYLQRHLRQTLKLTLTGIDLKPECIDFAQSVHHDIQFVCSDYRDVQFAEKPDIIFSSLFCHHFSDAELVSQLQWMKENSKLGFVINDLHRHSLAYYAIRLLTNLFSTSYLVKHDAPLSVAKGFNKKEWLDLFCKAGINDFSIQWRWAFRHLIIFRHGAR